VRTTIFVVRATISVVPSTVVVGRTTPGVVSTTPEGRAHHVRRRGDGDPRRRARGDRGRDDVPGGPRRPEPVVRTEDCAGPALD
jgi:hypothetical protein